MIAARVLHVDDEPSVLEVVRRSLEIDSDLTVRSCTSGAEALETLPGWRPDLVLLDVEMPDMNGPRTLGMLRRDRRNAAIPVVFLTAHVPPGEVEYFKSLGAAGVLEKPFDPDTLAAKVRRFLEPVPSGADALKQEFLTRACGYADDLTECMTDLASGGDRPDGLVHARQIANLIGESAAIFGCRPISVDAWAIEELLTGDPNDADLQKAVGTLVAQIHAAAHDERGSLEH